jgi:DNA-binding NarL/FixJ family response regulator
MEYPMAKSNVAPPQDSTQLSGRTATKPYRLVLVDDHPMVRLQLEHLLQTYADIEIVGTAADGEEAIVVAHRLRPEVIVMDFNMPKMNGDEATRRIVETLPETKVIGLSFNTNLEVREAFVAAGAVGFLDKQLAGARLHSTILAAVHHQ